MRRLPALVLCLLFAAACRSGPPSLESLYRESLRDEGSTDASFGAVQEEREERLATVREILATRPQISVEEALQAAWLLLDSRLIEDLTLARDLALDAGERGNDRGFPLAAEAIDREHMQLGLPQKYGTQYVYSPVTASWALYQWDPATTDAERQSMGVPPIAEAIERLAVLNAK